MRCRRRHHQHSLWQWLSTWQCFFCFFLLDFDFFFRQIDCVALHTCIQRLSIREAHCCWQTIWFSETITTNFRFKLLVSFVNEDCWACLCVCLTTTIEQQKIRLSQNASYNGDAEAAYLFHRKNETYLNGVRYAFINFYRIRSENRFLCMKVRRLHQKNGEWCTWLWLGNEFYVNRKMTYSPFAVNGVRDRDRHREWRRETMEFRDEIKRDKNIN